MLLGVGLPTQYPRSGLDDRARAHRRRTA